MNKDLYISLITKKLSSELNTAELKDLNAWLTNSKDNAIVLQDFKKVWQATSNYKSSVTFDAASGFQSFANRFDIPFSKDVNIPAPTSSFMKYVVSGILIILIGLAAYFVLSNIVAKNVVHNQDMHAMTVTLNEYSNVTLSPESSYKKINQKNSTATLSNAKGADKRNNLIDYNSVAAVNKLQNTSSYLMRDFKGQGYFDIKNIHNNVPYLIELDNSANVIAIDASFNVQNFADESKSYLDVQSGILLYHYGDKVYQLGEGERIILNESNGKINKVRTPDLNPFQWHKGILAFNNTPLAEVFNRIERFYGVDIEVMDDSPTSVHYTVSNMKPSSLNECLELLHSSIKMDIKRKGLRKVEIRNIQSN